MHTETGRLKTIYKKTKSRQQRNIGDTVHSTLKPKINYFTPM